MDDETRQVLAAMERRIQQLENQVRDLLAKEQGRNLPIMRQLDIKEMARQIDAEVRKKRMRRE